MENDPEDLARVRREDAVKKGRSGLVSGSDRKCLG